MYVADRENNRVQVFDSDGGFLAEWRDLSTPADIVIDLNNIVYIAEGAGTSAGCDPEAFVSIRTPDGEKLGGWKRPASAGAHSLCVDSKGSIYVNQNLAGRRLLKYRRLNT